jgi:hypothetical protein
MSSLTATLDRRSALELKRELEKFPLAVQDKVARQALAGYNREVATALKARTPVRTGRLKRSVTGKVKKYKGVVWGAVAHKTSFPKDRAQAATGGRARRAIYDLGAGWRSHFTELGYHSWPKGEKGGKGSGKGWKKGRYHRGRGGYHRGTLAMLTLVQVMQPRLLPKLSEVLRSEINKRSR